MRGREKMDNHELVEQMRSAKGISDGFAFCKVAYQYLSELPSGERPKAIDSFFMMAHDLYRYKKDNTPLPKDFSDSSFKLRELVRSLVDLFSGEGYTKEIYYNKLWGSIEMLLPDATLEEKGFCLFAILWDTRTPYYELPNGLKLSDEKFEEIFNDINPYVKQLDFAIALSKRQEQRTELTSKVVHLLDCLDGLEQKSVFLLCLLLRLEKHWEQNKANTGNNLADGSTQKEEPSMRATFDDERKGDSFLLDISQNDSEDMPFEIIEKYQYPDINGNEYEFILVKKGENVFLSDKGKTLKQLDEIFELKSPDVVEKLSAVLVQYGVVKQGNEFVVKIDDWNDNALKDENLTRAKLSLFSCVSFMLNMKIFYN